MFLDLLDKTASVHHNNQPYHRARNSEVSEVTAQTFVFAKFFFYSLLLQVIGMTSASRAIAS